MATVKIKFRPSSIENKEGNIYYQITQNRMVRQLQTGYRIFKEEWNEKTNSLKFNTTGRNNFLFSIEERIRWDIQRLENIVYQLEIQKTEYTAKEIITIFKNQAKEQTLFNLMRGIIAQLKQMGKYRTSETYTTTLKSFMTFRQNIDLPLDEINSDLIMMYETYLKNKDLAKNTTSFYMRILRAVYNRGVDKGLTPQRNPFKHVYTGIDKTVKRAVPLKVIKQIKDLDLFMNPTLDFARDMFLFSFYTRGMSFIDMAYLKKKDLNNGILSYRRHKTGQRLYIKWESCMQEIVDKYSVGFSVYLLPILKPPYEHTYSQYRNALYCTNKHLKEVAKKVSVCIPLTLYVARHSWASIARSKNIPISVISEAMGHDSEQTTQIYLASLDTSAVDNANSLILNCLQEKAV